MRSVKGKQFTPTKPVTPGGRSCRSPPTAVTPQTAALVNPTQSRAAAVKLELSGIQKMRQLVDLLNDVATRAQYKQQAAGVAECLQCFPCGFTPSVAQDGVAQLVHALCNIVAEGEPGSQAIIPALIDVIDHCGAPVVCVTLDDQRQAEDAVRCTCVALAAPLYVPVSSVRVAAASALTKIFSNIRRLAGDDTMSEAERREMGEIAHWRLHLRRSVPMEVLKALAEGWETSIKAEITKLRAFEEAQVESAGAEGHSDDDEETNHNSDSVISQAQLSVKQLSDTAKHIARARESSVAISEMTCVLKAIREVSCFSPQTADLVVECDACGLLIRTLQVCERGDRRVPICVEILWNMLELCPEAAGRCNTIEGIQTLYESFVECLSLGYKLKERELRNDFIVMMKYIADCDGSLTLLGPFSEVLLELSCGNEKIGGTGQTACVYINPKHHYSLSPEDQQAKVLCWGFLCTLCVADEALRCAVLEWGFVDVLVSYLDVHCDSPAVVRWSTPQLLDLQEQALLILCEIAEIAWEHCVRRGAPGVLHSYIAECPDVRLRNLAVTLLARLAVTGAKTDVANSGAVPVTIQLLRETDDDVLSIECLNLLADIVDRDPEQQRLFCACDGIQALLPRIAFNPLYHTLRREDVVRSAIDASWSCVFGNRDNEEVFIANDGVHACLCALESVSFRHVPFVLSALGDFFKNPRTVAGIRAWRSPKSQMSTIQLLIRLWEQAKSTDLPESICESDLGDAVIAPVVTRQGQGDVSAAAVHMIRSQATLIKIFACVSCIGFADHRELTPRQRATLAHMEVFEHLCNDLAWSAVDSSLTEEGIEPIASDRAKLDNVLLEGQARREALQTVQDLFMEEEANRTAAREGAYYKSLVKKTDEELPPGVVTSGMTITQAKIRKAQMLKQSFQKAQARQHAKAIEKAMSLIPNGSITTSRVEEETPVHKDATDEAAVGRWGEGQKAMTGDEFALFQLINKVRTDPSYFVPVLEERLKRCTETRGAQSDAVGSIKEALEVLQNARPIVTFLDVPMGMLFATRDHAADLAKRMDVSAVGFDGSSPLQRLLRYGSVPQKSAHLQGLGAATAEDILAQLLIDDGVPSRVDRRNLLDPEMRYASVSLTPHPIHGTVAIVCLTYEFHDKPREHQNDINRKVASKLRGS